MATKETIGSLRTKLAAANETIAQKELVIATLMNNNKALTAQAIDSRIYTTDLNNQIHEFAIQARHDSDRYRVVDKMLKEKQGENTLLQNRVETLVWVLELAHAKCIEAKDTVEPYIPF